MGKWIATVDAVFENKVKERYKFKDSIFEIRYTLPSDEFRECNCERQSRKGYTLPDVTAPSNQPLLTPCVVKAHLYACRRGGE